MSNKNNIPVVVGIPKYEQKKLDELNQNIQEKTYTKLTRNSINFKSMNKKNKIIDLFAGIVDIRLGFEKALSNSIECICTSKWNKYSVQTYLENFNDFKVYGDITQIKEDFIPDHDILLAGDPCQLFLQAGLKKGFADTKGNVVFLTLNVYTYVGFLNKIIQFEFPNLTFEPTIWEQCICKCN